MIALVEPTSTLQKYEATDDFTSRLVLQEEIKALPFGAVWDYYCLTRNVPVGLDWLDEVRTYERNVLSHRRG